MTGRTFCLSCSMPANQISSRLVEPLGNHLMLPIGATGDSCCSIFIRLIFFGELTKFCVVLCSVSKLRLLLRAENQDLGAKLPACLWEGRKKTSFI